MYPQHVVPEITVYYSFYKSFISKQAYYCPTVPVRIISLQHRCIVSCRSLFSNATNVPEQVAKVGKL
jgi:hypothetical protein